MSNSTPAKSLPVRLDEKSLQLIEGFRFDHRVLDRTKAIRYEINWALGNNPKPKKKGSKPLAKSQRQIA